MGKIFAMPAAALDLTAPAAPPPPAPSFDLWSVMVGVQLTNEKPRAATMAEIEVYLRGLAHQRGLTLPRGATFGTSGVFADGVYILDMPGLDADTCVTLEELDAAGDVVRTSRIGTDRKGYIGLKVDAVRKACDLPKVRKPRATKAAAVVEVVAPATPVAEAAPPVDVAQAPTPAVAVAPEPVALDAALVARLEALEAVVARLTRPVVAGKRQRNEAERRAILRAWRMRGEMRARADLDRRALLKVNCDNRLVHEQLRTAERARDALVVRSDDMRDARDAAAARAESIAIAHGRAMNRADRLARVAIASRTARRRLADDLRGARAEARALTRRLQDARTGNALAGMAEDIRKAARDLHHVGTRRAVKPIAAHEYVMGPGGMAALDNLVALLPAAPAMMTTRDSGAVAALAA